MTDPAPDSGPRGCIGNTFALMETVLVLAMLGQRVRCTLAPEAGVPWPSITLRPKDGVGAVVRMR